MNRPEVVERLRAIRALIDELLEELAGDGATRRREPVDPLVSAAAERMLRKSGFRRVYTPVPPKQTRKPKP
jgi:hypothetical protein